MKQKFLLMLLGIVLHTACSVVKPTSDAVSILEKIDTLSVDECSKTA